MIPRFSRSIDKEILKRNKNVPGKFPGYFFAKGRYALYALLKVLAKKEVIVPSYICESVIEAIVAAGKTPRLIDITTDLQLDLVQLKKIVSKNRSAIAAVVVPHYFGLEDRVAPVRKLVGRDILIVEDCAHLPFYLHRIKGDAALYSFNFDKPISLGNGGSLRIKNKQVAELFSVAQYKKIKPRDDRRELVGLYIQSLLMQPSRYTRYVSFETGKKLAGSFILKIFNYPNFFGKLYAKFKKTGSDHYSRTILMGDQRLGYLPRAIARYKAELNTLRKLEKNYLQYLPKKYLIGGRKFTPLLKFPIIFKGDQDLLIERAAQQGLELGNFNWPCPIHQNIRLKKYCIISNKLSNTEFIAKHLVQLPLYPNLDARDQQKVITLINEIGA